uniref:Uncharacterized protein n=1 Tax=Sphaerodactylus townsendi TaxID=933632 RepID=A0ACB8F7U1_9SAUR
MKWPCLHIDQTEPRQDWLMYPVTDDAQRDDSADLDDNQDVFDVPEEISDDSSEPESLPVPAAAAEGEEIPRAEQTGGCACGGQEVRRWGIGSRGPTRLSSSGSGVYSGGAAVAAICGQLGTPAPPALVGW